MRPMGALLSLGLLGSACSATGLQETGDASARDSAAGHGPVYASCAASPTAPPASLSLAGFYTQYLDADGIPVVASAAVDVAALQAACTIVQHMLVERPDVRAALVATQTRVGVMAVEEVTTDIPEHADLNEVFPDRDWNVYRGLGATLERNITTVGEENLLRLPGDIYEGESILVHEFGHTVWELGVRRLTDGPSKQAALQAIFDAALADGRWVDTYAGSDVRELWAEGTQSWFSANLEVSEPNGIHNTINTREELHGYDPELYALLDEVYANTVWTVP